MLETLRQEINSELIADLLRELSIGKFVVTLWQNQDGKRVLASAMAKEVHVGKKLIQLVPLKKNFSEFKNDSVLFFRSEHKSMLFKSSEIVVLKDSMIITIPTSMHLREMRLEARRSFQKDFSVPEITLDNRLESFRLHDISIGGASFIIPRGALSHFYIDDSLFLKGPGHRPDGSSVHARVMHISPYYEGKTFSNQHFRIGIKFKEKIDISRFITPYQLAAS